MTNVNMIAILMVLIAGMLALGFVSRHQFEERKASATRAGPVIFNYAANTETQYRSNAQ